MSAAATPSDVAHDTHEHHEPTGFWQKHVFSRDHKVIGKQFLFSSMIWALLGGTFAIMVRQQIAYPGVEIPLIGDWLFSTSDGTMPAQWYDVDLAGLGILHIFGLDTVHSGDFFDGQDQLGDMSMRVATSTAVWKIAFAHHPRFTSGDHQLDNCESGYYQFFCHSVLTRPLLLLLNAFWSVRQ